MAGEGAGKRYPQWESRCPRDETPHCSTCWRRAACRRCTHGRRPWRMPQADCPSRARVKLKCLMEVQALHTSDEHQQYLTELPISPRLAPVCRAPSLAEDMPRRGETPLKLVLELELRLRQQVDSSMTCAKCKNGQGRAHAAGRGGRRLEILVSRGAPYSTQAGEALGWQKLLHRKNCFPRIASSQKLLPQVLP